MLRIGSSSVPPSSRVLPTLRLPSLHSLNSLNLRQHSPIQLAPLRKQAHPPPDDLSHRPLFVPHLRGPLSSLSSLSSVASLGYYSLEKDLGLMRQRQIKSPSLFRCASGCTINTNKPFLSVTPPATLPEFGYSPCNASLRSSLPTYPNPTQHRGRLAPYKSYIKAPLSRFPPPPATTIAAGRKRYHCRYDGCKDTFTTSGHASRHLNIHTGKGAISCDFTGCWKVFTRSDNMKQHLKTHFKDIPTAHDEGFARTQARALLN